MPSEIKNFDSKNYNDKFIKDLYTEDFHNHHIKFFRPKNLNFSLIVKSIYNFNSVVDLGCSIGTFLEPFFNDGKIVKGYEYCFEESKNGIEKIPGLIDHIEFGDVTKDIISNKKYDCAISIEVAEHIPTEFSENLVKNLVNLSNGFILFTAAHPGQGGTGHINCQPKTFWINLFEKYNYEFNALETEKIKKKCLPSKKADDENEFPYVWKHVLDNLIIFTKKEEYLN